VRSVSFRPVSIGLVIALVALVAVVAFVWLTYNRLVAKRLATESSWSQIDVALRRRHDLIPALTEAVRGYASHERTTFEHVAEARGAAVAEEGPPPQRAVAEGRLGGAVRNLLVVAEAYPQLEATQNFAQLQRDLADTENQIQITRRVYNDTVETYNTAIQVFPAVLVARALGFSRREFFDAPAAAEATPQVDLTATAQ
jgi:LemA protein